MTSRPGSRLPASALEWLFPGSRRELLSLGVPTSEVTHGLAAAGHALTAIDRRTDTLRALSTVVPGARRIVAQAESLPFAPCLFDSVLACQTLHTIAPGLAYAEIARVLRPSGSLAVIYLTRDDSVPWVRRLAALLQDADPTAMRGGYGTSSVASLAECDYFPEVEHRDFRMWAPVTRPALVKMVRTRPSLQGLSADDLDALTLAVSALYDASARAPEPLLLPWRVQCWRARVDQSELSKPLLRRDDAVDIRL